MDCNSKCDSCNTQGCPSKTNPLSKLPLRDGSSIKKTIGIISGKGGVGKSLVTAFCAKSMSTEGYKVGVLDGDITGPSMPKVFGLNQKLFANAQGGILPAQTNSGIKITSINLMLENPEDPVIWRGPIIGDIVKQFWKDVEWGKLDYLFIDMPPGTGDVALTVFQSLPIDGIIIVTTPQDLVSMIVEKAVKMANMMNIPIIGIIENMSYFKCPDCDAKHSIFGESKIKEVAQKLGVLPLARIPIDSSFNRLCDKGDVEKIETPFMMETVETLKNL